MIVSADIFSDTFGPQVHAEVEFELLEGAVLAIKTLNGLKMQGQSIKVTLFLLLIPFTLQLNAEVFVACISNMFACVLTLSRSRGLFMSQCWTWI